MRRDLSNSLAIKIHSSNHGRQRIPSATENSAIHDSATEESADDTTPWDMSAICDEIMVLERVFVDDFMGGIAGPRTRDKKRKHAQAQKSRGNELKLSPQQEAEMRKLRKEQGEYAKLIREQQKDLRRQKDKLAGKITLFNVALMPAIVILLGLILFIQRRRSTRAR